MGKDTDDRNIAITALRLARMKAAQEKAQDNTGPFLIERPAPAKPQTPLKAQALTIGSLMLIIGISWGSYQAIVSMSDRVAKARSIAIEQHSHDITAHPDIRREIERLRAEALRQHKELLERLDKLLLSSKRRKRK